MDMEERVQDGLKFTVLMIVEAFKLEKRKISVGLVESFLSSLAKLIISFLATFKIKAWITQ